MHAYCARGWVGGWVGGCMGACVVVDVDASVGVCRSPSAPNHREPVVGARLLFTPRGFCPQVASFGFRGEALSSLCALADVVVETATDGEPVGHRLVYDASGSLVSDTPVSRTVGTTVSLDRLFHSIPVRAQVGNDGFFQDWFGGILEEPGVVEVRCLFWPPCGPHTQFIFSVLLSRVLPCVCRPLRKTSRRSTHGC